MVKTLDEYPFENIAYCYTNFEYQGAVNQKFPARQFNENLLRRANYISSNSMFKSAVLEEIPIIDDDYYKRLLDWAYYLHLLNNGYYGIPCQIGYFVAKASADSISAGGAADYREKHRRVTEDFVSAQNLVYKDQPVNTKSPLCLTGTLDVA